MKGKSTIGYVTLMLLAVAAAFVLLIGVTPVFALENGSGRIISGTVTDINVDSGYSYLTLRSPDNSEFTVTLSPRYGGTDVWMCDGYVFLHDVKVGDMVDISYFESGPGFVASSINDHGQGARTC